MADLYNQFFKDADKDNSGYLTLAELTAILRSKGYKESDDKIRKLFAQTDLSGDNKISLEEYLQAMGQLPPKNHQQAAMRNVFISFDRNCDGTIDKSELEAVFREMGRVMSPQEMNRMMAMCDKDGSGTLNYEEFIAQVFGK